VWSVGIPVCHCPGFEFDAERGSNEGSSQSRKEIEVRLMKRTIGCVPRAILSAIGVEKAQHETPCEALELYQAIKV
jgi:hypothetical protein